MLQEAVLAVRGFLGLSSEEEAGQCSALQASRQGLLCLPSSSHPTLFPHPSPLCAGAHRPFVACAVLVPGAACLACRGHPHKCWSSDKGNLPHLSHHSIPKHSVSAVQGSPSETPWHISEVADATAHWKGLCSPCPTLRLLRR